MLKIYNSNLGLRLSCYDCQFKGIERDSDITLGDFWSIENVMPEMDDGRGCSCIITHSQKGERLLQEISDKLVLKEVPIEHIIAFNSSLIKSSSIPKKRESFWKDISHGMTLSRASKKYDNTKLILKLKRRIKELLK